MASDVRQLYVMVNPTIPGLVKVGMTTVGVNDRARGLSSGLPTHFQVHGYVELPALAKVNYTRWNERRTRGLNNIVTPKTENFHIVSRPSP